MKKNKKQELKIVFGGFIVVLVLTFVLGYAITSRISPAKAEKTTAKPDEQQTSTTVAPKEGKTEEGTSKEDENESTSGEEDTTEEDTTEEESPTEEESSTEEDTTGEESSTDEEDATDEGETVDGDSSPFDPVTISIDDDNWELTLLNANYKLPEGYAPELTPAIPGSSESLDKRVQPHYEEMYNAAKAEGIYLTPYSGYRSIATQTRLHTNKVNYYKSQGNSNYEAEKLATRWSMLPGCSEHNFGIAMDICNTRDDFDQTAEYAWLTEHAAEYGFIQRYKGEKEEYTGVAAEPWHWRYVGKENAEKINAGGLCLEEYLGKTD